MLDVLFTVDVELWCDGWDNIDVKFPGVFRRYVYGPTPKGNYGLPYQLAVLKDHGLKGIFFVEPLFSKRFGIQPLAEIVGLVRESEQEIQLHLHTEWVDESIEPLFDKPQGKRQFLHYFSREEQATLISAGKVLINTAGGGEINAFRAGSFGFNKDTIHALAVNGVKFDSSYNASMFGPDSGLLPGITVVDAFECGGVCEYPVTVFNDGTLHLRQVQLTACSYNEMAGLLWQALEARRNSFVILSHNFELLNEAKNRPDDTVVRRFHKLCSFLDRNRDSFRVRGFKELQPRLTHLQPSPLVSPIWRTGARMIEQAYRRKYR